MVIAEISSVSAPEPNAAEVRLVLAASRPVVPRPLDAMVLPEIVTPPDSPVASMLFTLAKAAWAAARLGWPTVEASICACALPVTFKVSSEVAEPCESATKSSVLFVSAKFKSHSRSWRQRRA